MVPFNITAIMAITVSMAIGAITAITDIRVIRPLHLEVTLEQTRLKSKVFSLEDFRLLFWSLLLQRKSKVCGLMWGGINELEVES